MDIVSFNRTEANLIQGLLNKEERLARQYQYTEADRKYYEAVIRALGKIDLFLDTGSQSKDQHLIEEDVEVLNLKADKELIEHLNKNLIRIRDSVPTGSAASSFKDPLFNIMIALEGVVQLLEVRTNRKLKKYGYPTIASKRSQRRGY